MRLKQLIPLLFAAAMSSALAQERSPLNSWYDGIEQGYQTLARTTGQLDASARAYCGTPSEAAHAEVEQQWRNAFNAWQAIRFVDFGPIERDSLAWQFQFWPDPKNLIARKAAYYLDREAPVTTEDVDQAGVAVQGFPMLEYLLFDPRLTGTGRSLPAGQACSLLTAVSTHLAANATAVSEAWRAQRSRYLATTGYEGTTVEAGMSALTVIEQRRLGGPMGLRGNGKRSVYVADAWRAGHSLAAVEASLQGLYEAYLPGLELALDEAGETALAKRIRSQFKDSLARLDTLPPDLAPLLADDRFGELQGLYADLSQLASLLNDQAGPALGVVRGFNSSDGD